MSFSSRNLWVRAGLVAVATQVGLGWPGEARACGGLFCSASNPVNQTAERILFAQDGNTTTQIVEILYEGPSENFAWVLPVPGTPEVAVSSNVVFQRLQAATNPQYTLTNVMPDDCDGLAMGGFLTGSADSNGVGGGEENFVSVLNEGAVGPYDFQVIAVDADAADPAQVAVDWLAANDYDLGDIGADVLRPYLEIGLNLIAIRLQKDATTGSIRPLALTFSGDLPSIPIRPTAVAANDDMGVLVWVLGDSRAVPANYNGLELNEMYIDWTNAGGTYDQVVSLAADEAGGQGFVTEFAGAAAQFHDAIDNGFDALENDYEGYEPATAVDELTSRYGTYDGYERAFSQYVTLRDGLAFTDYVECPGCEGSGSVVSADVPALVAAVREDVLKPISDAADLFQDHAYVTRLYTTMSAEDMDLDPLFDFNPDLEDVSNIHTAERKLTCDGTNGPWKVTLPNGKVVYGEGFTWPLNPGTQAGLPLNARIVSFKSSGAPDVDMDNTAAIDQRLAIIEAGQPNGVDGGIFSCSLSPDGLRGTRSAMALGLLGLGVVALRRRTRQYAKPKAQ